MMPIKKFSLTQGEAAWPLNPVEASRRHRECGTRALDDSVGCKVAGSDSLWEVFACHNLAEEACSSALSASQLAVPRVVKRDNRQASHRRQKHRQLRLYPPASLWVGG